MDLLSAYVEAMNTPGLRIKAVSLLAVGDFSQPYHPACALESSYCRGVGLIRGVTFEVVGREDSPCALCGFTLLNEQTRHG